MVNMRLILKYNAVVGRDPLPRIKELAAALGLEVEPTREEADPSGKRRMVVPVRGSAKGIAELERKLLRLPAVTAKLVS